MKYSTFSQIKTVCGHLKLCWRIFNDTEMTIMIWNRKVDYKTIYIKYDPIMKTYGEKKDEGDLNQNIIFSE